MTTNENAFDRTFAIFCQDNTETDVTELRPTTPCPEVQASCAAYELMLAKVLGSKGSK